MASRARTLPVIVSALCLATGTAFTQTPAPENPKYICGQWRVQGIVASTPYASVADVVKPLFGVEAKYTAIEMRFGPGVTIAQPLYRYTDITDTNFDNAWQVNFAQLRVKGASTHIVEVRDRRGSRVSDRPGTTIVVRNDNEILVPWEGHFLGPTPHRTSMPKRVTSRRSLTTSAAGRSRHW